MICHAIYGVAFILKILNHHWQKKFWFCHTGSFILWYHFDSFIFKKSNRKITFQLWFCYIFMHGIYNTRNMSIMLWFFSLLCEEFPEFSKVWVKHQRSFCIQFPIFPPYLWFLIISFLLRIIAVTKITR